MSEERGFLPQPSSLSGLTSLLEVCRVQRMRMGSQQSGDLTSLTFRTVHFPRLVAKLLRPVITHILGMKCIQIRVHLVDWLIRAILPQMGDTWDSSSYHSTSVMAGQLVQVRSYPLQEFRFIWIVFSTQQVIAASWNRMCVKKIEFCSRYLILWGNANSLPPVTEF